MRSIQQATQVQRRSSAQVAVIRHDYSLLPKVEAREPVREPSLTPLIPEERVNPRAYVSWRDAAAEAIHATNDVRNMIRSAVGSCGSKDDGGF